MVTGDALVGDVGGKIAIIVDDLIPSGHHVARQRRHAVTAARRAFSPRRRTACSRRRRPTCLAARTLTEYLITDSLPAQPMPAGPFAAKLQRLSVAPLIAEAIARLSAGGSGSST